MLLFLLVSLFRVLVFFPPLVANILDLYSDHYNPFKNIVFRYTICGFRLISSLDFWYILKLIWKDNLHYFKKRSSTKINEDIGN